MAELMGATTASAALSKRASEIRQVGDVLSGRFDVLSYLGASDTTALYLARDKKGLEEAPTSTQPQVMLEVLREDVARDPRQLELFYLQAEAAAKLRHRNILKSGKATSFGGFHLTVIEHKPGLGTLSDLLNRKGWLEPELAVAIIYQVAVALSYAHGLGVLHLKLQPESVLLEPDGNVLVTGFGIEGGANLDWAHRERSRRALPHYISPEQASDDRVDHCSDLYSLGIILFEMLTDRLPFNAESPEVIRRKRITQSPLPPNIFRSSVSRPLSEVTMKLLKKKAADRFENGASLISVLDKLYDLNAKAPAAENGRPPRVEPQSVSRAPEPLRAQKPGPALETDPGQSAAKAVIAEVTSDGVAETVDLTADDVKHPPSETNSRTFYETPAISLIEYPRRQYYESSSEPKVPAKLNRPTSQNSVTSPSTGNSGLSTGNSGLRLYAALIITAFVVTSIIVLVRADYLPKIFRFQAAESALDVETKQNSESSEAPAPSDIKSEGSVGEPESASDNGAADPQETTNAPSSTAKAAPLVQKPQVKKSVRRSKYRPRKYRVRRR